MGLNKAVASYVARKYLAHLEQGSILVRGSSRFYCFRPAAVFEPVKAKHHSFPVA